MGKPKRERALTTSEAKARAAHHPRLAAEAEPGRRS